MKQTSIFISLLTLSLVFGACDFFGDGTDGFLNEAGPILFLSDTDGEPYQLYSMEPDGTDIRQLTKDRSRYGIANAVWSPDGGKIALVEYSRFTDTLGIAGLYVVDSKGRRLNDCQFDESNSELADQSLVWSPDSHELIYRRGHPRMNYIVDINTCDTRLFRKPDTTFVNGYPNVHRTQLTEWVSAGNRLIGHTDYSLYDPITDDDEKNVRLTFWTLSGDSLISIGKVGERLIRPVMSPSGNMIAASKRIDRNWTAILMTSHGIEMRLLTGEDYKVAYPVAWSFDESHVLVRGRLVGANKSQLLIIDLDGYEVDWIAPFPRASNIPTSWRTN